MAVVLAPLALGILFSEYVVLPIWLWMAMLSAALFIALRYRRVGTTAICVSIFALGGLLHSVHIPNSLPYGERVRLQMTIDNDSRLRGDYCSTTARVTECNRQRCQSGVVVYSDTTLLFKAGDRIEAVTTVRPFKSEHRGYASLMYHRGYVGTTNISHWNIENLTPAKRSSLHGRAVERLRSLIPPSDARAVVMAMGVGSKSEISPQLTEIYSRTGTAHLLAVSGLHVGIVFLLVNLLLTPLTLLYTGNILRSIFVVASIWVYVFLCGMSPSAIRAAIMFSLLQLSLNSTREYLSENILAGTAFLMLIFDPNLLFDIGFSLSFTAVAGIIFWGAPLLRLIPLRVPVLRQIIELFIIGFAASLAVMPQVAHSFGVVPVVGVLINPIIILTANLILLPAILSLVTPIPLAAGLLRVAEWCAEMQNHIVGWCSDLRLSGIEYAFSAKEVVLTYAVFGVLTLLSLGFRRSKSVHLSDI